MKRILFIIVVSLLLFSCKKTGFIRITPIYSVYIKSVELIDKDGNQEFIFIAPISTPDEVLLQEAKRIRESLKETEFIKDSFDRTQIIEEALNRSEFIIDSINFRRATRIINGGYGGWDSRYQKWLIARSVLGSGNDTLLR